MKLKLTYPERKTPRALQEKLKKLWIAFNFTEIPVAVWNQIIRVLEAGVLERYYLVAAGSRNTPGTTKWKRAMAKAGATVEVYASGGSKSVKAEFASAYGTLTGTFIEALNRHYPAGTKKLMLRELQKNTSLGPIGNNTLSFGVNVGDWSRKYPTRIFGAPGGGGAQANRQIFSPSLADFMAAREILIERFIKVQLEKAVGKK